MKPRCLILLCLQLFIGLRTNAQSSEKHFGTDIQEASSAFEERDYLKSARAYARAFQNGYTSGNPLKDHFQAAYAWASANFPWLPHETTRNRKDSAMLELGYLASVLKFSDIVVIETEYPFITLREHPDWELRRQQIRLNATLSDPASDSVSSAMLERIKWWKDNKWIFERGMGCKSPTPTKGVLDSVRRNDSICFAFVDSLLKISGGISPTRIGRRGLASVISVVRDAPPEYQTLHLPKIRSAANMSTVSLSALADLEDMVALHSNGKQIYGTQIRCDSNFKCWILPIQSEAGVDLRRKSMGLEPLDYYLRKHGITTRYGAGQLR